MRSRALAIVAALVLGACGQTVPGTRSGAATSTQEGATLQVGNDALRTTILTRQGSGIGDPFPLDRHPRWGCPPPRTDWSWTHVEKQELSWVRISVDRMDWEQAQSQGEYSRFHVNACQDEMVSLFAKNGIEMLMTIVYWDPELNAERPPNLSSEEEIQLYLDYARFLVHHFKDRIEYFEILNEAIWYVDLPDYLELIRRVIPVIREEDPDARIVAGGASDLREQINRDYLFGLLNSDVAAQLDGIAWHPFYSVSPQFPETAEYYAQYPDLVREIEDTARANGFAGEFIAQEMEWRTPRNPSPWQPWVYPPVVAAKYFARGIAMHRGMGIWAGIGGEMYDRIRPTPRVVRNLSTVLDGAEPETQTVQIQTQATDVMSYGFTLPTGDRMLALWTNGVAVEEDAGVPATLTFMGDSGTRALGIDVLGGVQQALITERAGSDLVIRDLLVKDYPIFVRVDSATPAQGSAWTGTSASGTVILQQGNDGPQTVILAGWGNGIGDLFPLDRHRPRFGCPPRKDWSWTHVEELALSWVQISVDRMDWEQATSQHEFSRFRVNPCQDEMVSLFARTGITMLHTIVYWDEELNAERPPDLTDPEEFQLYLDYARFLVRHFKGRIEYYGILNESWWYVALPDYLELIRQVVPIIREEDPEAKIVAGGATDLRQQESRDYLFGLVNSNVVSLLDGIILHPLFGESPQYPETAQYYAEYPALVVQIEDAAAAHGFTGEYFTSGMCWRTKENPFVWEPWEYTPVVAAKYYARAVAMHRGMGIWAGIGGEMYDRIHPIPRVVRNLGKVLDGAEPETLVVRIETSAEDVMSYGFVLPDGDRLFALWTNGVAVEDDPGTPATLTFPGDPAASAVGVDVLEGFQQELVVGRSGSDLVIRDLLVKDYPIFVRLDG